jgi:hypothetical protein
MAGGMTTTVADPYGIAQDPAMPTLDQAVDPAAMQRIFDGGVAELGPPGTIVLEAIRVVRYKPARRCLIEYDLRVGAEALTAIGKVRRNRPGHHQHRLLSAFWNGGFAADADDGISVPEPLGRIPELALWLQRRVEGVSATDLLAERGGAQVAARMADAAHKIHRAGIPTHKAHAIDDELRILTGCLASVARSRPDLAVPLDRLARDCIRAARRIRGLPATGIHRDYYADQVIVGADRLTVVDFDLYTTGDPAVDIGNLVGHIAEQALREHDDPGALSDVEDAAVERYVSLAGERARDPIALYAALTSARHVFLSHDRTERSPLVPRVLDMARERVDRLPR